MFSELREMPELRNSIILKENENELDAVQPPMEDVTIIHLYQYSTAIWDYIKSRNAEFPDLVY